MVTSAASLQAGQAAVGVALKGGQIPADGVAPGDIVAILQVPAGASAGAAARDTARVLVDKATVYSSRPDPAQAGGTLVTVIVPAAACVNVAAASGAGQAALVEVPSS
jgi:hypothetical protein